VRHTSTAASLIRVNNDAKSAVAATFEQAAVVSATYVNASLAWQQPTVLLHFTPTKVLASIVKAAECNKQRSFQHPQQGCNGCCTVQITAVLLTNMPWFKYKPADDTHVHPRAPNILTMYTMVLYKHTAIPNGIVKSDSHSTLAEQFSASQPYTWPITLIMLLLGSARMLLP
jgi:hypothetical protein